MPPRHDDHVAVGWKPGDESFRWIEAGRLRLDEDKEGAFATIRAPGCDGPTWLSATELAGLSKHLIDWFTDEDPVEVIRQIEAHATFVKVELEAWDDRARIDEEHPPYDQLVRTLDGLLALCKQLRAEDGPFGTRQEAAK